jgi:hypothetical protein
VATYYVKNGGSDFADGTSDANAWETLNWARQQTYTSGDHILLKRGSTFNAALILTGAARNGTVWGAYGTGARPIVNSSSSSSISITSVANLTVQDLLVTGANANGIGIGDGATGILVQRVEVRDSPNDCFHMDGTSDAVFRDIMGTGAGDDCFSQHSDTTAEIIGGVFANSVNGINNIDNSILRVSGLTIVDCSARGVQLTNADANWRRGKATLWGCFIRDCVLNVEVEEDFMCELHRCLISGGTHGVKCYGEGTVLIERCDIDSALGVWIAGSGLVKARGCSIIGDTYGVQHTGTAPLELVESVVTGVTDSLVVSGSPQLYLSGNTYSPAYP